MDATADKTAIAPQASGARFGDFKSVSGSTGKTLYVLQEEADYFRSMELLSNATLRPVTYQELLPLLMNDEYLPLQMNDLMNLLKEKWFWLAGDGMDKSGRFTIDDKGKLREITEKEKLSEEWKVYAWPGKQRLMLHIDSDDFAADRGQRYHLGAHLMPQEVAPVVVGVPAAPTSYMLRGAKE